MHFHISYVILENGLFSFHIVIKDENLDYNGIRYETKEDNLETIKKIRHLDIQGIKIHMLHILKNTKLAELYEKEKFHVLTKNEYVDIVCDQLDYLRPEVVINRITGDPKLEDLIYKIRGIKK